MDTAELVTALRELLGTKLVAYLGKVKETRAVRPDPELQTDVDEIVGNDDDDHFPTMAPGRFPYTWCEAPRFGIPPRVISPGRSSAWIYRLIGTEDRAGEQPGE